MAEQGASGADNRAILLILALLTALMGIAYWPALQAPFVYDDLAEIVANTAIHDLDDPRAIIGYNPARLLLLFTFAIQWALHGPNPLPYHLFNIAIHLLSAWLVFRLGMALALQRLGSGKKPSILGPALMAGVFLLHPLFVETVTYIASRSSGLCALFYLASVFSYQNHIKSRGKSTGQALAYYGLTLFMAALAVATKELAATLPAALILTELVFGKGSQRGVKRWLPLAIPFLFLAGMVALRYTFVGELLGGLMVRSIGDNLMTETGVVFTYLLRFFWPSPLSIYHDIPTVSALTTPVILTGIFHIGLISVGLRGLIKGKVYAFPILWFYLTLLPTSSVVPLKEAMAEHRAYLPGMGLLAGFGALLPMEKPGLKKALAGGMALVLLLFTGLTRQYNQLWVNEVQLWEHTVNLAPHSGDALYALGDAFRRDGKVDEAIQSYEKAIKRYEDQGLHREGGKTGTIIVYNYPDALNNLGLSYAMKGDLDRAIPSFRRAARAYPNLSAKANTNLGYALIQKGQFRSAEGALIAAIDTEPGSTLAHWHLANLYYGFLKAPQKSLEHYQIVIALNPNFPEKDGIEERILELSY